jgi:hypothetical protein
MMVIVEAQRANQRTVGIASEQSQFELWILKAVMTLNSSLHCLMSSFR